MSTDFDTWRESVDGAVECTIGEVPEVTLEELLAWYEDGVSTSEAVQKILSHMEKSDAPE